MSEIIDSFIKNGYVVFRNENEKIFLYFKEIIEHEFRCSLDSIHSSTPYEKLNEKRMAAFRAINSVPDWENKYFSLAKNTITDIIGKDLSIQTKLNLSIQCPNDSDSVLELHTDTLSGQSNFETVLWIPFTDAYDTNSMFIFDLKNSQEMLKTLAEYEQIGMGGMFETWREKATFLKLSPGDAVLFSSTLFHGNTLNITKHTRVSFNCRFKGLFSPEFTDFPTERNTGSFYKPFKMSPATKIGMAYDDSRIEF